MNTFNRFFHFYRDVEREKVIKMRVLGNLEPNKVFYFFEEICNIPHGSYNLDKISEYLENFAKKRNLFCIRDKENNIIIIKEATTGYETVEPIMLQGHMDMVAVKTEDCDINFLSDPLRLKLKDDYIYAEGTSLGGDDGIAVAYILAILDSDNIEHPRIEAVITTNEETGMEGATYIDLSMLKSKRMLNIDSEEEGILLTSCAGGVRVDCKMPINKTICRGSKIKVELGGLIGGHSGTEINKRRGNAIKLLARTLHTCLDEIDLSIVNICGGEKDNAIPRDAYAEVILNKNKKNGFTEYISKMETVLKNEYKSKEKDLYLKTTDMGDVECDALDASSTYKILNFLYLMPNGVVAMSNDIEGLVETSLNVGVLNITENNVIATSALRSSIETSKNELVEQLRTLTELMGGSIDSHGDYPGWQYDPNSKLRALMIEKYKEMFSKEPQIEAIHAGLECGIMISKLEGLDCVSFGPNIFDIHTTEEKLSISSTERMWKYLLEILKTK